MAFTKPVYDPKSFFADAKSFVKKLPRIGKAIISSKAGSDCREKVMLAVTNVNDCRYCNFVHTNLAKKIGVPQDLIDRIKAHSLDPELDEKELVAIEYARHFAKTGKKPDPEMTAKLIETYGEEKAEEMMLWMEVIFLANLSGNTFDAFLSRFRGDNVPGGNLPFEVLFAIFAAPILLPQTLYLNLKK